MQKVALLAFRTSVTKKFSFKQKVLSVLYQWALPVRLVSSRYGCVSEKTQYLIFHTVDPGLKMHQPATLKCPFGFSSAFCFLKKAISCFRNPICTQDYKLDLLPLLVQRKESCWQVAVATPAPPSARWTIFVCLQSDNIPFVNACFLVQ